MVAISNKVKNTAVRWMILFCLFMLFMTVSACRISEKPLKVACLGTSATRAWQIPDIHKNAYPGRLGTIAGKKWDVHNFGVGGATVMERGNIPYWKTRSLRQALALEPDIVICEFGGNDAAKPQNSRYLDSDFLKDYSRLIEKFAQLPSMPHILLLIYTSYEPHGQRNTFTKDLKKRIEEVADTNGVPVLDLFQHISLDSNNYICDRIHPSIQGNRVIAQAILAYIIEQGYAEKK